MAALIEIILLLFIAAFLVLQQKNGLRGLLNKQRKIILDSCALIDGRIVEIVKTGFVVDELVIPQFILNELQLLADGNDSHKRERARFGLDIAHELQDTSFRSKVTIDRTQFPNVPATDDKLIQLAKKMESFLYTTDYNLSKVAAIEGVGVLNVNELVQGLRPVALPGETLQIKILQKGSNPSQGVGYLEDGTMIVVEGGARHAGKSAVEVVVTRMHQTVAGKMVFGQVRSQSARSHGHSDGNNTGSGGSPRRASSPQAHADKSETQQRQPQSQAASAKATLRQRLARPAAQTQPASHAASTNNNSSPEGKINSHPVAQKARRIAPHRQSSTRAASLQKIM